MTAVHSELTVEVGVDGADDEELAELTSQLRDHLLDLDVYAVSRTALGETPDGSHGAGPLEFGSLAIQFLLQQEILQSIINSVRFWLGHRRIRAVKLTLDGDSLELTDATSEQQERLVEAWVNRHA